MKKKCTHSLLSLFLFLVNYHSFAEGVGPGLTIPADGGFRSAPEKRIFYVYAKAGESITWTAKKIQNASSTAAQQPITIEVYSPNGLVDNSNVFGKQDALGTKLTNSSAPISVTTTTEGIWTIVFSRDALSSWTLNPPTFSLDVVVKNSSQTEIKGRLFVNNLRINHSGSGTKALNMNLYTVNNIGYKYQIDLFKITPIDGVFVFDGFGNLLPDKKTSAYASFNSGDSKYSDPFPEGPESYKIFINPIADDIPASASRWDIESGATTTDWLLATSPKVENVSNLKFTSGIGAPAAGSFSFDVENYSGNATLYIDGNNNGSYDDATDRKITIGAKAGTNTTAFDGKDAAGNEIACRQAVRAKIVLDRKAEIHLVLVDIEGLGGLTVKRLNGTDLPDSKISWDDSHVTKPSTSTKLPTPVLTGSNVSSDANQTTHGWEFGQNADNPWGNDVLIDNWAFLPGDKSVETSFTSLTGSDFGDLLKTKWSIASARVKTCSFTNDAPTAYNGTTMNDVAVWAGDKISTEGETRSGGSLGAATDTYDDGIGFPARFTKKETATFTASLNANKNSTTVFYALWFDWDNNGTFDEAFTGSGTVITALQKVSVSVPVTISSTAVPDFKIRLIISDAAVPALTNTALAISSGEIEDYIAPPSAVSLPVKLSGFSVAVKGNTSLLTWATETEVNNAGFTIERSSDGTHWSGIGYVASLATGGNSNSKLLYRFTDEQPVAGRIFYRLKQTDLDGTSVFSETRVISFDEVAGISVYPTYAISDIVTIKGVEPGAILTIYNSTGVITSSKKMGNTIETISLANYSKGLYLLQIVNSNGEKAIFKVVK